MSDSLLAEGRDRRDAGLARASTPRHRRLMIATGQLALLDAIATSPDGTGTTDDIADDAGTAFADGGRWRGAITHGLARLGLIERIDYTASYRPSRHGSTIGVWRLAADARQVDAHRGRLRLLVAALRQIDD